jgi:hypothetical protein
LVWFLHSQKENGYWLRENSGENGFLVTRWLTTLLWLSITQDEIREGNQGTRVRVLDKMVIRRATSASTISVPIRRVKVTTYLHLFGRGERRVRSS